MRRNLMFGFTLIELMVTVAVVAILASIAFPSYQDYILRSRRAEGKAELLRVQQNMERAYTDLNSYASAWAQVGGASAVVASEHGYYQVIVDPIIPLTAATYTLNSVPQGAQSSDACGTLTVNEQFVKAALGGGTNCW